MAPLRAIFFASIASFSVYFYEMKRILYLGVSLFCVLLAACTHKPPRAIHCEKGCDAPTGKPNIIIILADDLGRNELSIYGGMRVPTPNIDAIGKEGVMFTEGYSTAAICAPSRAGLLTGRYQERFGFEFQPHLKYPRNFLVRMFFKNMIDKESWSIAKTKHAPPKKINIYQGLPADEGTLAEYLKQTGYHTAICGKWHLGASSPCKPNHRGFDYQYGFYEAFSLYADPKDDTIVNSHQNEFTDKYIWKMGRKKESVIRINDSIIDEKGYMTFNIAAHAKSFIREHKTEPFFLYVPFSAPHTPFQAPISYYNRFPNEKDHNKRVYFAMIAALDEAVGQILEEVKSQGLDDNTLIIFSSDNGSALYTGAGDNSPYRGGKFSIFEGGTHVPLLIRWKGIINSGSTCTKAVNHCDIFSTSLAAANLQVPEGKIMDGVNLLPLLNGTGKSDPHEALYWRSGYNKAIRKNNWKLIIDEKNHIIELYDLTADPGEHHDLAKAEREKLNELLVLLKNWDAGLAQPMWPYILNYKVHLDGKVYEFAI